MEKWRSGFSAETRTPVESVFVMISTKSAQNLFRRGRGWMNFNIFFKGSGHYW